MTNSTKASPPTAATISSATMILGVLCFNGVIFLVVLMNLITLIGSYWYPISIGLPTLAYYSYILSFDRCELDGVGRPWRWFSENAAMFHWMRQYLDLKLIGNQKLAELDSSNSKGKDGARPPQMILAVFPHGSNSEFRILLEGILPSILPNTAHNVRSLAATILFRLPILRQFALWTGCIDASKASAKKALSKGKSLLIVPGGQAEQIRTEYGKEQVYLLRRKGFLKLAITHDIPVVPVYVFGCSDYYKTLSVARNLQLWIVKTLGISIPLAFGQFGSPWCPLPVPTTVVFGEPLSFSKKDASGNNEDVMPSELDEAHEQFCTSLRNLFDAHKDKLGYGDRDLQIS